MSDSIKLAEAASPAVWRYAHAKRAHVVVDAAEFFDLERDAMSNARHSIFMIGWDFDTRIRIAGGRRWWSAPPSKGFPARLGAFVVWLVRRQPALRVNVLIWNFGAFKYLQRGSMILDLLRWTWQRNISVRYDGAHPIACSHHQKIVVIDDTLAACGGIDMTGARWDTREHLDDDRRRRRPNGRRYGPWHDVTMLMEGEVAGALADLGRERWQRATGETLPASPPSLEDSSTSQDSPWPERLVAEFEDVEIGIARTRAAYRDYPEVREIEALFVEQIAAAKHFVYAETQYFASRRIAEAIAHRLAEPDPPEFVIINPLHADGWLQQQAMDTARVRLLHALRAIDHKRRFHLYIPYTAGGTPIYVHAKLTIIDDRVLRVGSANMNNRSMGLDSECDVFIDSARPGNADAAKVITGLRHSLIAEHCGLDWQEIGELIATHGSMAAMIDATSKEGKRLARFELRELSDTEKSIADSGLLDPERPQELFEPIGRRGGLFRRGSMLRAGLKARERIVDEQP